MQAIKQCTGLLSWMLGLSGPAKSPELLEAERMLTKEELEAIKREHCCHVMDNYSQLIDENQFLEWCGLQNASPALAEGLCQAVRSQPSSEGSSGASQPGQVSLDAIIISKAKLEKMDQATSTKFAFSILDPLGTGAVARDHLVACIAGCMKLALYAADEHTNSEEHHAAAIADGALTFSEVPDKLTLQGYRKWSKLMPAVHNVLTCLLSNIGRSASIIELAACERQHDLPPPVTTKLPVLSWGQASKDNCLLQPEWVWLLQAGLPPDLKQEWRCLFSSYKHGMSFSTFISRISGAAPTLVLIRDKGGHIFGGIAYHPWRKTGTFYGDVASCIVSLEPKAVVYPASGINTNIQWCGVGFSELPNGIGFGGQQAHFGVWVDASMDTGMSRPNATFASPSLSNEQKFNVEAVECWLLKPPDEEEDASHHSSKNARGTLSALDQAKEDQKLLEWGGRVQYSAGVRQDEPLEED